MPDQMCLSYDTIDYWIKDSRWLSNIKQLFLFLQFSKRHEQDNGIADIGLAGHYIHSEPKHTDEMDKLLAESPDWATPVTWAATWDGFVFWDFWLVPWIVISGTWLDG